MNPRPSAHPAGHPRRPGTRTGRIQRLLAATAITAGLAGAGLAAAGPAAADSATSYVIVGADTTEGFMNAFAASVGQGILGSWNAENPVTRDAHEIITPAKALAGGMFSSCSFTRPGKSREGFYALDLMTNPNPNPPPPPQLTVLPQPGCIDISRSSGKPGSISSVPGSLGSLDPVGDLIYIPFAVDGVTTATGPTTAGQTTTTQCAADTPGCTNVDPTTGLGTITFTAAVTNIVTADMFTVTDLQNLYACTNITEGGVTYNPNNPAFPFTASSASPAVFTAAGSAYAAGATVQLTGPGLPGGFTAGTTYFVVNPSGTSFQLAATADGTAINSTTAGSGTVQAVTAGQQDIDLYAPQPGSDTLAYWASDLGFSTSPLPACVQQTIVAGPAAGIQVAEHDGSAYASDPNGLGPFSIPQWITQNNGLASDLRRTAILHDVNGIAPVVSGVVNSAFPSTLTRPVWNVMQYDRVVNTGDGNFDPVLAGLFVGPNSRLCQSVFTIKIYGFDPMCGAVSNNNRVQESNSGPG